MEYDPALVESGYWEADGAYDATLQLLDQTSGITAVYAQNDSMAQGVLSAARAGARDAGGLRGCRL
jgi:ABC-type sugar transport system substrate-binding protein